MSDILVTITVGFLNNLICLAVILLIVIVVLGMACIIKYLWKKLGED